MEEETLRDRSKRQAEDEAGGFPGYGESVPRSESQHPSLRAQLEQAKQPKTREFGHGNGVHNDELARATFEKLRRMLGG